MPKRAAAKIAREPWSWQADPRPRVHRVEEAVMTDHIYRVTEIVGSSPDSIHQAVRNGIARASTTLRNLDWFEVTDIRGHLENGEVGHFQVTMKVGFRLDEPEA